ncbi:MAG: DUF1624 domain-containing protein [Candidatus Lokiarchaeota archaeon]|nr:DUF1624 domain-containing protein [Candidatus Lokiarchaeota archaeon]
MSDISSYKKQIDEEINNGNSLETSIEDITSNNSINYEKKKRLDSLDFVKGLAIILIILSHLSDTWLSPDWRFLFGIGTAFLDIFGPSLFILLSALSVVFSIKKKKDIISEKVIRNKILFRGLAIMVIGLIYNFGFSFIRPDESPYKIFPFNQFPLTLWGWNILFFMGFTQIASYYILKLNINLRIVIGILIIIIGPLLREFIFDNRDLNPIYLWLDFFITSPSPQLPFLPWVSICFISTAFGEYLYKMMVQGTKDALIKLYKSFFISGIIFIISGIIIGFRLHTSSTIDINLYETIDWLTIANSQKFISFQFPGMPEFLIRSTISNMFYLLGWALLIIAICIYYIDIKGKRNKFNNMIIFYGKSSLSLFLIMFSFIYFFKAGLPTWFFLVAYFGILAVLGFLMYIWIGYFNGIGTPEWIMGKIGGIANRKELKKE